MKYPSEIIAPIPRQRDEMAAELKAFVAAAEFPCVGAKAALRRHQLEIIVASDIRRPAYDRLVTEALQDFAARHDANETLFVSQAVIFQTIAS